MSNNYLKNDFYNYLKQNNVLLEEIVSGNKKYFFVWDYDLLDAIWISKAIWTKLGILDIGQEDNLVAWKSRVNMLTTTRGSFTSMLNTENPFLNLEFKNVNDELILTSTKLYFVKNSKGKIVRVIGVLDNDWNSLSLNYNSNQFEILLNLYKLSITQFDTIDGLHNLITKSLSNGLNISKSSIWFFEQDRIVCKKCYNLHTKSFEDEKHLLKADSPNYFESLQKGIAIVAANALDNNFTKDLSEHYLLPHDIKSILDIPLRENGELVGIVCCENVATVREWTDNDISFVRSVSDIYSLFVEENKRRITEKQIIENQDRFKFISENISDGIYIIENDKLVFASSVYLSMLGITEEEKREFHNQDKFSLVHPDDIEEVKAKIITAARDKKASVKYVFRCLKSSGEYQWREDIMNIHYDISGIAFRVVTIARDITNEKNHEIDQIQKEKTTYLQNKLLVRLYSETPLMTLNDKLTFITSIAIEGLQIDRSNYWEVDGDHLVCKNLVDKKLKTVNKNQKLRIRDLPNYFDAFTTQSAIVADDVMSNEFTSELVDNYLKPLGITDMLDIPVRENGKIHGVLCFEHRDDPRVWSENDISFARALADYLTLALEEDRRKKAEKKLRENQERLKFISENTSDGIVVFENKKVTYVSPAFEKLSGFSADFIMSLNLQEIFKYIHPDDIKNTLEFAYSNIEQKKSKFNYEYRCKMPSGEYYWREDSVSVIYNDLSYSQYIIISRDINERKKTQEQLLDTEQQLSLIFKNSTDGFVIIEKHKVTFISDSYCELLGYSIKDGLELTSEKIIESLHPDDRDRVSKFIYNNLFNKISTFKCEFRIKDVKGNYHWREDITNVIYDKHGIYSKYIIISRDINERKKIELQLVENEKKLRLISENTSDGIFVIENDIVTYMSPVCKNIFKYSSKQEEVFTLEDMLKNMHTDSVHSNTAFIYNCLSEKKEAFKFEQLVLNPNNEYKWREDSVNVLYDTNGKYSKYIVVTRDINDKKIIELQLGESEKQLRLISENTSDGVAVIENGILTYVSPAYSKLLNYDKDRYKTFSLDDIFNSMHPEDSDRVKNHIYRQLAKQEKEIKYEHRFKGGDGVYHWREDSANVIYDENRQYSKYIVVTRDISDRKKSEKEKNFLFKVTQKQNEKLLSFTHIVSHDIRSHTSNMSMILELFEDTDDQEEQKEYFEMLKQSTNKLSDTIFFLNETVAIQSGVKNLKIELNLKDEVEKAIHGINAIIKTNKVTINIDIPDNLFIDATQSYLESIIFNLLTNAIKYKKETGKTIINIVAHKNTENTIFTIQDNGIGIDLIKNKDKIFGMYKTFHGNQDAVGLGLFMVKNHIESMGGSITVDSNLGIGTTFTLFFV